MVLAEADTPLPGDRITQRNPLLITAPDWFSLNADSIEPSIIDHDGFNGQLLDLRAVGARPEGEVDVRVQGTVNLENRGPTEKRQQHDADAIADLNQPLRRGLIATQSFTWSVLNNSNVDFDGTGGNDEYQSFLVYEIRDLTVLEKLQLDIPLVPGSETQLAEEILSGQDLSLRERDQLNLPPAELDPIYRPNLEGKNVLEEDVEARTVDVNTGEQQTIAQESVRRTGGGTPQDIIYLTGLTGNWFEFGSGDDLTVHVSAGSDEFYVLNTFGLPGMGGTGGINGNADGNTFPAFYAPLHLPFFDEMRVWLESANNITNVDIQVEYARVDRTLIEKALYDLDDEITAPRNVSQQRRNALVDQKEQLFDQIQRKLRAGLPIRLERREARQRARA